MHIFHTCIVYVFIVLLFIAPNLKMPVNKLHAVHLGR